MKNAIEKAIEGGWKHPTLEHSDGYKFDDRSRNIIAWRLVEENRLKPHLRKQKGDKHPRMKSEIAYGNIFLDPLFWQALGKSLGWKEHGDEYRLKGYMKMHKDGSVTPDLRPVWEGWQYAWHRFIDHLASGKDAESFFTTLLSSNQ